MYLNSTRYSRRRLRTFLFVLALLPAAAAHADVMIPTGVNLSKALYFADLTGNTVRVEPGLYLIDAVDNRVSLAPVGLQPGSPTIVQGTTGTHDEALLTRRAFLLPPSTEYPGSQHLLLYLPDGTVYEAIGSETAVVRRGRSLLQQGADRTQKVKRYSYQNARLYRPQIYWPAVEQGKRTPSVEAESAMEEDQIMKMIMESKNATVEAVVKMMNNKIASTSKVQSAAYSSRSVDTKISTDQCTEAAQQAMLEVLPY